MQRLTIKPPTKATTLSLPQNNATTTTTTTTANNAVVVRPLTIAQPTFNNLSAVGPSATNYKQMDQRTHVYTRPASYVGSDQRMERELWLFDAQNNKMFVQNIDYVEACERIFLEILTNASDNVNRSQRAGVDPGKIEVTMNNSFVVVKNYGLPIPIEMHSSGKCVPELIFGTLLTSSNYEGDRHEAGVNGIGAKATNIFSKIFKVVIHDAVRHLKYTKIWYDNMTRSDDHIIEAYDGKISSVEVLYQMDFARFGYPVPNGNEGGYTSEVFALYHRHVIDISFNAKTPTVFNGIEYFYANIRDYGRLYFGDAVETAIVHYQWPEGTEIVQKKKGYQVSATPGVVPLVEIMALDTPDEGRHVSFANCMMTHDGGVHVNAAIKAVGDPAVQQINKSVMNKLMKLNKGKEVDAKEKRSNTITIADVKPHMSMLVAVRVVNPSFTSQTKRTLASPTPKIVINDEELKGIDRWKLLDRLHAALEAKQFAALAKTDGKLKRHVRLQKGVDANQAGGSERSKCILYITEGKSGAGYANKVVANIPNGRDYIGVFPMRGKSLNVMNAEHKQIEKNNEIFELKKMLGLAEGVDYTDPKNFARLRYGSILIMADSDVDGKHIIGLIINIFHCRFPSLLACGFVMFYRSPTIRVTKNKTTLKFFTKYEYDEWRQNTADFQTWTHQYFKGMGTSEDDHVKDDIKQPRVVKCFYDSEAPAAIKLAFDAKLSNLRKEWVSSWKRVIGVEDIVQQPISLFINQELVLFSIANIQRSIPSLTDGLKDCHRKIIHAAHKKWKIGSKKGYDKYKVAQFEGFVASTTHYEHAEANLSQVVIGLAQEFTCSNNIPMLAPRGQFGSRYENGEDAAASRYIYTHPHDLLHLIFRKEDRPILKHKIEEGTEVEPETYYPVIPIVLVNGAKGIATAWSTTILNYDPLQLIQWLRLYLQGHRGESLPELVPYYRGYTGVIKLIDRRKKKKSGKVTVTVISNDSNGNRQTQVVEDDETDYQERSDETLGVKNIYTETADGVNIVEGEDIEGEPEPDYDERPLISMVSFGKFTQDITGKITITELPIGRVPIKYRKWLEQLQEDKKISDYRDLCTDNTVCFEIMGFQEQANHRSLKLRRTIGMTNMVLLDEQDKPIRYDTAYDICEAFVMRRLPMYQARKNYILGNLLKEVQTLHHKIRFIRAVIDKEIIIVNTKISYIRERLEQLGIPYDIYENSRTRNLSEDDIINLQKDIAEKEQEYQIMASTTPEQLWMSDLEDLEQGYRRYYKITNDTVFIAPQDIIQHVPAEELNKKREPRAKISADKAAAKKRGKADNTFTNPNNSMLLSVATAQTATPMPTLQPVQPVQISKPIKLTLAKPINNTETPKLTLTIKSSNNPQTNGQVVV